MKGEKIPAYQIKGKEANSMGRSSLDKETVEHQFDTLIKLLFDKRNESMRIVTCSSNISETINI